ncbi:MAG: hypothetical protein IKY57_02935 [Alistipes sp.]|nr:hypothetical protein [Alistipes sp.]
MKIRAFILTLVTLLFAFEGVAQVQLPKGRNLEFGLQAHRGLSHRYPENTALAFREAAKVPYYFGMETDVQMTSDGVLVCMHDTKLDRTTNGTGKVSDYTWAELRKLWIDGGTGWNAKYTRKLRIPTFKEYLKICKKANLVPYVELKLLNSQGIKKTVEMLHKMGFEGKYVLTSFKWKYLREAAKYSSAPLEFMKGKWTTEMVDKLQNVENSVIRPSAKSVTKEFVDYCHSKGFIVECYGLPVGNEKLAAKLKALGVKGATCNDWQGLGLD